MQLCLAKWKIKCCCWSPKVDSHFSFFTSWPLLLSASLKILFQHAKFLEERNSSIHSSASCWDSLYLEKAASKKKKEKRDYRYIYSFQTLRHTRNIQTQAVLPSTLSSSSYKSTAGLQMLAMEYHKKTVEMYWSHQVLNPSSSSHATWKLIDNQMQQPGQGNGALTQKVVNVFWKASSVYVKKPWKLDKWVTGF